MNFNRSTSPQGISHCPLTRSPSFDFLFLMLSLHLQTCPAEMCHSLSILLASQSLYLSISNPRNTGEICLVYPDLLPQPCSSVNNLALANLPRRRTPRCPIEWQPQALSPQGGSRGSETPGTPRSPDRHGHRTPGADGGGVRQRVLSV